MLTIGSPNCWHWISSPNAPAWVLVIVGVEGIVVAIGTLKIIERQTKATETAATAALLNAQAAIIGQRPWLLVPTGAEFPEIGIPLLPDVGDRRACQVTLQLRNFGQTPARIVEQKINLYIGESQETIPKPSAFEPIDSFPEDYTFPQGEKVPVEANLSLGVRLTPEDRQAIVSHTKFLWLCGYCKYQGDTKIEGAVYETRFCYVWINYTNRPEPFWLRRGPREYNKAT